MAPEKQQTAQQANAQYTPTPEETELNQLLLERTRAAQQGQIATQQYGTDLINNLLTGQALPGYLNSLPGGISPDVTQSMVDQSIADIQPTLQKSGLLDSGINAALSTRTAADIRNANSQFNIQNLLQLLNLAVGGQAQVQAPLQNQSSQLSSSLAGLRTTNTSGNSTTLSMNPFLKSFQNSFGDTLGSRFASVGNSGGTGGIGNSWGTGYGAGVGG